MDREAKVVEKTFTSTYRPTITQRVELFTCEKLDYVEQVKKEFGLWELNA